MTMRPPPVQPDPPLLEVENLVTEFQAVGGVVRAVDRVGLRVHAGEILAVVGESGSGKSVTALSIMRLIRPPGRIVGGSIRFVGRDLLRLSEREMRDERGRSIGMIFQNPYSALHPFRRIGAQMVETLVLRAGLDRAAARRRAAELLARTHVERPEETLDRYPHEVSLGTCQKVMLALAVATGPKLLIADEPTTNLDAVAQLEILQLLGDLRQEYGMAVILITHDFSVVAKMADSVQVMYAGRVVERGTAAGILNEAAHPYSRGLIASARAMSARAGRLEQIPGDVPDLLALPAGCAFSPRCAMAGPDCSSDPPAVPRPDGGMALCWRAARVSPEAHHAG